MILIMKISGFPPLGDYYVNTVKETHVSVEVDVVQLVGGRFSGSSPLKYRQSSEHSPWQALSLHASDISIKIIINIRVVLVLLV